MILDRSGSALTSSLLGQWLKPLAFTQCGHLGRIRPAKQASIPESIQGPLGSGLFDGSGALVKLN